MGGSPDKAAVLQLFSLCIKKATDAKCEATSRNLTSASVTLFKMISLAQHVVETSDSKSENLVPMNRLPPPHPWWCISGISCSLSEGADWIDVFSLHDPF